MFKAFVELVNNLNQLGEVDYLRKQLDNKESLIRDLNKTIALNSDYLERITKKHNNELSDIERREKLSIEEAKNEIRKEMQKDLILSDLKRVEAIAKLETHEKHDTKNEMEHIKRMLEKAIEGLTKTQAVVNVNKA